MTETTRFEIAKLELREGDRLVVKCDQVLSREQARWIEDHFRKLIPESVGLIVLGAGMTLDVLRRE
ncbi:hypothetical protein [Bradyrhizobium septentrionale]|uniref:Uncharacterized protein n=1 Tax=Bradyrhizobium septentrionale TaxID=1404411 RepID=A0ABZ2P891_9BRAD